MNADGLILDVGADVIGHNMYIYCANNPVNSVDYNGEAVQAIPFVIPLIIAAIPEETWEAAGQAVGDLISGATEVIKNTISTIKKKTSSSPIKIQSNFPRNNTVYTLRDIDGTVQYVGRTTNPLKRAKAHQANPARAELSFNVEHSSLTRPEARGLEQYLIIYFSTLNKSNPMNNQINGIAWDNPRYRLYMNEAQKYFFDSETYVGP